jgi:S-adenosylmethionine synthetase
MRSEYQASSDRNRAALQAQLLGQGFGQAQQLAQQNMANQLQLGSAQQGFLGQDVGALSTLGAQNQALAQAQLSANQQLAQAQLQQPLQAAQALGAGITGLIAGYPGQTQQQISPSSTLAQTALGTGATLAGIYRGFGLGQ